MAKIQPVWALDIGQAALKALKLGPGTDPEKVVAEAFDFVEYPKILSQPDAEPEALVKEALQTFLERNDLKGAKIVVGVSGQAGLVKFIKLPPVEKKRIPDIVKFEARQQIPFALEEVIWDYQQIGGDDEGDEGFSMAEVGLFAMKRDQIGKALFPLQAANIEVDAVQMGPIALYNFATFDFIKPEDKDKGSAVLLDIGADNTDLIITDGVRIWQRNVPIGGNHFTRALTKELKLTFAKAEHLKRNATKAPDPRAVFTAMRGVFNDFASEVNRSIGFYQSVNRTSKIGKVIGMGNGFKLPGLQKFLQQNLTYEVEKLEGFERLTGDEVKGAPQFQENLPSFAIAYGLAIQGLARARLRTNLLPPEIERVRMIRRKKPWAAASAGLVAAGVVAMAVSDWRAYAKVSSPEYASAIASAKAAVDQGGKYKGDFEKAKGDWQGTANEGKSLIPDEKGSANMPEFYRTLQEALVPDPLRDPRNPARRLNPDDSKDKEIIDRQRIHIDAIKPVWSTDLGAWFDGLPQPSRFVMHPYDRDPKNKPTGEGWVVQVVGHHFNPLPGRSAERIPGVDLGPIRFLTERVVPNLGAARYRQFGLHHATFSWMKPNNSWVGDTGSTGVPGDVPILARNATPKGAAAGPGGAPGPGAGPNYSLGAGGGYTPSPYAGPVGMGRPGEPKKSAVQVRTRTDFKLEMLWKPEEKPKKIEEIEKDLQEAAKATKGVLAPPSEEAFAELSKKATLKAIQDATAPAAPAPGVPGPGGAPPVPGAVPPGGAMPPGGAVPPGGATAPPR